MQLGSDAQLLVVMAIHFQSLWNAHQVRIQRFSGPLGRHQRILTDWESDVSVRFGQSELANGP